MASLKNYISRNLLSAFIILTVMWVFNVYALNFPSSTPAWEVTWGKLSNDIKALNQKIENMIVWCPLWNYIGSFDKNWVPKCYPLPTVNPTSCTDWIKNWAETWVDCWWTCPKACTLLISWAARHNTSCASITANGNYLGSINCWGRDSVWAQCKLDFIAQKLGYKTGKLVSEMWGRNIPVNAACGWGYGTYFSIELQK